MHFLANTCASISHVKGVSFKPVPCMSQIVSWASSPWIRRFGEPRGGAGSVRKASLSLLKVLDGVNQDSRCQLVALTVDEGVKGYREESIAHASELTRQLNIEHVVVSYEGLFGFSLDKALDW